MPQWRNGRKRTPSLFVGEFRQILDLRDADGLPYLLIGGQAVDYWAERYLMIEPELRDLLPFTSLDIDFRGTKADVERIAKQMGKMAIFPPKVAMTARAGAIPVQLGNHESLIEVVRRVFGVVEPKIVNFRELQLPR